MSRSTLSLRMSQLTSAGYVREVGQLVGATGRPAKILSFDDDRQLVVAVDLGATHAHLALIDAGGRVHAEATSDLKIDAEPDEVIRHLVRRINDLISRTGLETLNLAGIGVGIPGPVRFSTQRPNTPPLMPGWHDYPIADRLNEATGLPAFVDNDANLMGLGEARVRYPEAPSLIFVKVGTGIGAGVILHGRAERGIAGGGGDIGHIRIVHDGGGALCTCGATGCLATEASGGALARKLRERGVAVNSASEVAALVAADDPLAVSLAKQAGRQLGEVLATSVALLNPAVLVLGGSLATAGPYFVDAVRETVFERTVPLATKELTIAVSGLGDAAGVQGARHMVIDQAFSAAAVDERLERMQ